MSHEQNLGFPVPGPLGSSTCSPDGLLALVFSVQVRGMPRCQALRPQFCLTHFTVQWHPLTTFPISILKASLCFHLHSCVASGKSFTRSEPPRIELLSFKLEGMHANLECEGSLRGSRVRRHVCRDLCQKAQPHFMNVAHCCLEQVAHGSP